MTVTIVDPSRPVIINVSAQINPAPADLIRKFMKVSSGDTNLGNGNYAAVTSSDWIDIFTGDQSTTETYKWLTAFFAQAPNATAYVLEATAVDDLAAFIEAKTAPMYMYSVPAAWYNSGPYYTGDFVTLVKSLVGLTAATYFAIEITHGVSPAEDPNFAAFAASKSLFPIYGNGVTDESVPGTMVGIMASPIYDLSASNKATMLNYKKTAGVTVEVLDNSLRTDLNNNGVNYVGEQNGMAMIFNGRYADLTAWDYWYNWDWTQISLFNDATAAIINGSNVPSAAIQYNQNGLDALLSVANGTMNRGKAFGTVTEFGSGLNPITQQLEGKGSFAAIPYYAYIAQNPSDYAAGIYSGFSAYVLIGRFIRQVVFNITIN